MPGPATCSTCSMSSLWSLNTWVRSVSLSTVPISVELFCCRKPLTSMRAWFKVPRELSSCDELFASTCDAEVTCPEGATICALLGASRKRIEQYLLVLDRPEDVGTRIAQPASDPRELAQ